MGLVVIAFMTGKGFASGALIGLLGAVIGSVVSTRIMQRSIIKAYPNFKEEGAAGGDEQAISFKSDEGAFLRGLNAILDGGKTGVELGLAIIPGVLIISTFVMILTFGASATGERNVYYGAGLEFFPIKDSKNVRIHAFWQSGSNNLDGQSWNNHNVGVGFKWRLVAFERK